MPELKDMLAKATFGSLIESDIYLNVANSLRTKNANTQARRESLFKNLNLQSKKNENANPNRGMEGGRDLNLVKRTTTSFSQEHNDSMHSEVLNTERKLSVTLELADSSHNHLFVLDMIDKDLFSHQKTITLKGNAQLMSHHTRKTVVDVTEPRRGANDNAHGQLKPFEHKKSLLASTFFASDVTDKIKEVGALEVTTFRQALLKRERRNFCLVFFVISVFLILASIGATSYLFIVIYSQSSTIGKSVQIKCNFLQLHTAAWNIRGAFNRATVASEQLTYNIQDFYFNQMIVG